jgi:hypothetical protein
MLDAANRSGVRLVGATSEEPSANETYLASNQILAKAIVSIEKSELRVSATPTLILVRSDGRVVNSWVGQLPEAQEREVLKAMQGGS